MDFVLIALTVGVFLFLVAAVVGLVRPALVKQETRPKAFFFNLLPALGLLVIFGMVAPERSADPTGEGVVSTDSSEGSAQIASDEVSSGSVDSKAKEHLESVVASLRDVYSLDAGYVFGDRYCSNENYCQAAVGSITITSMGYIVEALPSSKASPRMYQNVCSAIFIALSDSDKDLAEQTVAQTFNYAAENGRARASVAGVDMDVRPKSDSLLACKYVKP